VSASIHTPDQRLRVFVSSTLDELAVERRAAQRAITALRLTAVMFESGARPHAPQSLYRAYLTQSDVFVGLYWQEYGQTAPGMQVSGLEEEYELSAALPRLLYIKTPALGRDPRLAGLLSRIEREASGCYRMFRTPGELGRLLREDLAILLSERFAAARLAQEASRADDPARAEGQLVVGDIPREPPEFVARRAGDLLAEVTGRGKAAVVCAVTGLRGVGKTQIVAAYARERVNAGWGLVGWVNAESADTLAADLARLAGRLGVADPEGDSTESARRLREHLAARAGSGLLVFDNATAPEVLRPFLPATGGTQLVITTTDQDFAELGEPVEVPVFTRVESVRYLLARTGLADEDGADAVAGALGDLPLALAQCAATIRRQHLSYPGYLEQLRSMPVEEVLRAAPGGDYPDAVGAALLLSVRAAEASDPTGLAGLLLRVIAAMSPDGIRQSVLAGLGQPPGTEYGAAAAIERLVVGSLLTWSVSGDTIIMHRLLGRVLRERDQASGHWPSTLDAALHLLVPQLFPEEDAWSKRDEGSHLIAQIDALWNTTPTASPGSHDQLVVLLQARTWAVRQLWAVADYNRAVDLGSKVLADSERVLGPDHAVTLTARDYLAEACRPAGQLDRAIAMHEHNLASRQHVLGTDDPDTLTSRGNLASACIDAGQLERATELHEQNLADRERINGGEHPDTILGRNNLASAYLAAGDTSRARQLFHQALLGMERTFGPDHPKTLKTRNNLAAAYADAGRTDQAIMLDEYTFACRERVLGADHPDTLRSEANLGFHYWRAGRLDEAIARGEHNFASRVRVLGPSHPETLMTRNNLASAYASSGRVDEAILLNQQNLADRRRILGPDHPDTLRSQGNLADNYATTGRFDDAVALHEETLAGRLRVLGPDHPLTLRSAEQLAAARTSARSDAEARNRDQPAPDDQRWPPEA
jgi:tetratricopeptide (TPR) repeat protein